MKLPRLLHRLSTHLAILTSTLALPSQHIPEKLAQIKKQQQQEVQVHLAAPPSDVQTFFFSQKLNHLDPSDASTFRQRYFYTDRYVHDVDSTNQVQTAAFLCIGGEGPSLTPSSLVDSIHCSGDMIETARRLHEEDGWDVHLFPLEHRYYGDSFPENDSSEEEGEEAFPNYKDLTYLSSRQAVRDVIAFVSSMSNPTTTPPEVAFSKENVKWITFGGSYPGMLSTWSRLLHPHVIYGSVANSAPVQPLLDFYQYYNKVAEDLGDEVVGGSEVCRDIFVEGHEEIVSLLKGGDDAGTADALEFIAELFNVCDGADALRESPRNIEILIGDGVISVPSQGNDPSCEKDLCNIEKLCNAIITERNSHPQKSSMHILSTIHKLKHGNECTDTNWQDYIDYYSDANPMNANDRSWLYQTCTEFGFYQTCPLSNADCPYAKGYHEIDRDLELCQKVFGIPPDDVRSSVRSTLDYYGGWNLTPSAEAMEGDDDSSSASGPHLLGSEDEQRRILFVNGDVDPWSELAVSEKQDDAVRSVLGASHHFWTHSIKESDGDAVVDAREEIYQVVSSWLGASASMTAME